MKQFISSVLGLALMIGAGSALACPGAGEKMVEAEPGKTSVAELDTWRKAGGVAILDATQQASFEKNHIPGAVHMRYDNVVAASLPADKATKITAYCANEMCGASKKLAKALMGMGYQSVYVLPEGIQGWIAAGKEVSAAKPAKVKADG